MTEDEGRNEGGGAADADRGDTVALAAELSELAERQRRLAREAAGGERGMSGPEGTAGEIIEAGAARDGGGRS